jgi:hypothetical protein
MAGGGRRVVVLDEAETSDDLVRDVTEVLTALCAWRCGQALRPGACHTSSVDSEITQTDARLAIQTEWGDVDAVPVQVANQFGAGIGVPAAGGVPDGVYLTMGHLSLPILLGSPDEIRSQLETKGRLTVAVQARFFLTRARLDELIGVLTKAASQFDAVSDQATREVPE